MTAAELQVKPAAVQPVVMTTGVLAWKKEGSDCSRFACGITN